MADLIKVRGCDRPERRGDVIFVHGLNGNPREYWFPPGEPDKFWPAWVGEDLPDVGVWSLGYENAALKPRPGSLVGKFLQRGFAMPLEDRADNVLLRLVSHHIGERPLVFITHSMGGLLVKEMLRTANDSTNSRRKAIVEQTRGVCFIATPQIGSDLAKWASYFKALLGTNVAMNELRPHEAHLRKLNQWYRDFVAPEQRRIKTLSFYEMKPTAVIGRLVVEPGDADPGVPNAGLHPLDEDHSSICKPRSKYYQIHVTVTDFIRRDCLPFDDGHSGRGPLSPPVKPDIPKDTLIGLNPFLQEAIPHPPSADGPSEKTVPSEPDPRLGGDSSDKSGPSDEHYTSLWETYRLSIQSRLEELLGRLVRDEGTESRSLRRVAETLSIEGSLENENPLGKRIAIALCDSKDDHYIPKLMGLHDQLCKEGLSRAADVIWDCVSQIFPLYISLEVFVEAWRQLDSPEFVLIRGTVAKEIGAEVLLAGIDGKGPSIVSHVLGPRGEFLIPFEWPATNTPSLDDEVLAILLHLARQANVPFNEANPQSQVNDVTARIKRLSDELTGWLEWDKPRKGRTPYCALAMLGASSESDRRMRVLKRVRELVKPLMFIELNPESQTLRRETSFFRTAVDRFAIEKKRP